MEKIRTISGNELVDLVRKNPDWIGERVTADNPLVVTTACGMTALPIRQLSPFITFQASADFSRCLDLTVAEGEFHMSVNFTHSGIREIGNLRVLASYKPKEKSSSVQNLERITGLKSATFQGCMQLKIARGYFLRGVVDFAHSGIEEIDTDPITGLRIEHASEDGLAASFIQCTHLKTAEGKFPGFVDFNNSGVERIGNLDICGVSNRGNEAARFTNCRNLKIASGHYPGTVHFGESGITGVRDLQVFDSKLVKWDKSTPGRIFLGGCSNLIHVPQDVLNDPRWAIDKHQKEIIRNAWLARKELKRWDNLEL